jgi:hypothetical protein
VIDLVDLAQEKRNKKRGKQKEKRRNVKIVVIDPATEVKIQAVGPEGNGENIV